MTGEEKIQRELDGMTRDEKLIRIKESIWDWEHSDLVESVFSSIEGNMKVQTDSDFDDEYYEWFAGEFEGNEDYDDDIEQVSVSTKCQCNIHQLMRGDGHDNSCIERL